MSEWVKVCAVDDIEPEDVMRFDHAGRTFAVYRSPGDEFFASDGYCTHEQTHLADGVVIDDVVECPKHNGRFDYRTGRALGAPVLVDLVVYPTRRENGFVYVDVGAHGG